MTTHKLFDKFELSDLKLVRGKVLTSESKYITYNVQFTLIPKILCDFLTVRVFNNFNGFTDSKLKTVRTIMGLPTKFGLVETTEKVVGSIVTDILSIIRHFTNYTNPHDLAKSIRLVEMEMPKFVLNIIQNLNYANFNRVIPGTDTLLICEKTKITICESKIDEGNDKSLNLVGVCLNKINQILKLLGYKSFITIKNYNVFFETPENIMNCNTSYILRKTEIQSVKVDVGPDHTEDDVILSMLILPSYEFSDKSVIRSKSFNLTFKEICDIVYFNEEILIEGSYVRSDGSFVTERFVDATVVVNKNSKMEGNPYTGKRRKINGLVSETSTPKESEKSNEIDDS